MKDERRWCSFCQGFHSKPYPKRRDCKASEPEYQRRYGMTPDMLDYN